MSGEHCTSSGEGLMALSPDDHTVGVYTESRDLPPCEDPAPPAKGWPKSVLFILGNEFCERFSFYGMKAILVIYLTSDQWFGYSNGIATAIVHSFVVLSYSFSIVGGVVSDSWLGKFRMILFSSMLYCVGCTVLSVTAIEGITGTDSSGRPLPWGLFLGLILIGVATGGIKPCVSAFIGDQFVKGQERMMTTIFSLFYFSINSGSLLSYFVTPILANFEYWIAFGVPAVLLVVALLFFVGGYPLYIIHPAQRPSIVLQTVQVIFRALFQRLKEKKLRFFLPWDIKRAHCHYLCFLWGLPFFLPIWIKEWVRYFIKKQPLTDKETYHFLDYAKGYHSDDLIEDAKVVLNIILLFSPLPIFWSLFDQTASTWTLQAKNLDRDVFGYFVVPAASVQVMNPIILLAMIPVFNWIIYPFFVKIHLPLKPLTRMIIGMVLTALSFLSAGAIEAIMVTLDYRPFFLVQVVPYFLLSCGEVMVSVTGLEVAYSQAPARMKSVVMSAFLTTTALGNLIVVFFAFIFEFIAEVLGSEGNEPSWVNVGAYVLYTLMMLGAIFVARIFFIGFKYKNQLGGQDEVPVDPEKSLSLHSS